MRKYLLPVPWNLPFTSRGDCSTPSDDLAPAAVVAPVPPWETPRVPVIVEAGSSKSVELRAIMPMTRTMGPSMAMTHERTLAAHTQSGVMGSGPMVPPR